MLNYFPKAKEYLESLDINSADPLDKKAFDLVGDEAAYERASQALRRRFARGASVVKGVDRNERETEIKREGYKGNYHYFLRGEDYNWNEPEERIWVVAMYALWQDSKKTS
jgi:hypothetical protein